jgi:hypothetical protein
VPGYPAKTEPDNSAAIFSLMLTFALLVLALFAAILICLEIGWRIRSKGLAAETSNSDAGLNALDGAVFALMGLLIAFTFSGAASRFEVRRSLIVQETNDIGTAYLRLDMLPADAQPALRQDFRDYVDARLKFYASLTGDLKTARAIYLEGTALQQKIWAEAVAATARQSSAAVTSLVLGSLNSMIDDTTTRLVALETHPPLEIYIALAVVVMASSLLAGFAMAKSGRRNWTHMLIFAVTLAFAVYLILDLDYPRLGLIRIDSVDHILVDLRNSMK